MLDKVPLCMPAEDPRPGMKPTSESVCYGAMSKCTVLHQYCIALPIMAAVIGSLHGPRVRQPTETLPSWDQLEEPRRTLMRSHLQGMFFRTARMLESGMKPVYIFDGKPPDAKKAELNRRFEKRGDATEDLEKVKEVWKFRPFQAVARC